MTNGSSSFKLVERPCICRAIKCPVWHRTLPLSTLLPAITLICPLFLHLFHNFCLPHIFLEDVLGLLTKQLWIDISAPFFHTFVLLLIGKHNLSFPMLYYDYFFEGLCHTILIIYKETDLGGQKLTNWKPHVQRLGYFWQFVVWEHRQRFIETLNILC